jgi:hypothetical protein
MFPGHELKALAEDQPRRRSAGEARTSRGAPSGARGTSPDQRGLERDEAPAVGLLEPYRQRATALRLAFTLAVHLDGHPAEHQRGVPLDDHVVDGVVDPFTSMPSRGGTTTLVQALLNAEYSSARLLMDFLTLG